MVALVVLLQPLPLVPALIAGCPQSTTMVRTLEIVKRLSPDLISWAALVLCVGLGLDGHKDPHGLGPAAVNSPSKHKSRPTHLDAAVELLG
jgi:hypothetical protein